MIASHAMMYALLYAGTCSKSHLLWWVACDLDVAVSATKDLLLVLHRLIAEHHPTAKQQQQQQQQQ
jgi:hypothetical protein